MGAIPDYESAIAIIKEQDERIARAEAELTETIKRDAEQRTRDRECIEAQKLRLKEYEDLEAQAVELLCGQGETFVCGNGVTHRRSDLENKCDYCVIEALRASNARLREALADLLADVEDYQRINNLGGENNHSQVRARAAIAEAKEGE